MEDGLALIPTVGETARLGDGALPSRDRCSSGVFRQESSTARAGALASAGKTLRSARGAGQGLLAGLIGVAIAVLVVFAWQRSSRPLARPDGGNNGADSVPSPETPPDREVAEAPEQPRRDVASERAALDAAPQD